jgi:hypothetical protein
MFARQYSHQGAVGALIGIVPANATILAVLVLAVLAVLVLTVLAVLVLAVLVVAPLIALAPPTPPCRLPL